MSRPAVAADPLPRRGEAWFVTFDFSIGSEIRKARPAVIVSNDAANASLDRVQLVPISSRTERLYPAEAEVILNGKQRKVMADQITTADRRRVIRRLGVLSNEDLDAVVRVLRLQLGL